MTNPAKPRRGALRYVLLGLAAVVLLIVAGIGVFVATFNPNQYKPRIVAAVRQATGRELTLSGPIGLAVSLYPTLQATNVALANPPGFSRPEMATIGALRLRLDLLALLSGRVAISQLDLVRPDILLERTKTGATNWSFTPAGKPPAAGAPAPSPAPAPGKPAAGGSIFIGNLLIENGKIGYRDDTTGKLTAVTVQRFGVRAAGPDAPVHLTASVTVNKVAVTLSGQTGPLSRLQDAAATTPWPVRADLAAAGAKLAFDGTIAQPLAARGYKLAVKGSIPDLAALQPLLPGVTLPALRQVVLNAQVADTGAALPAVSALTLRVGRSDLSAAAPGLVLSGLDVSAPALDQPMRATASGTYAGAPLQLTASLGAPAALLSGKPGHPFPIDVSAEAAGGSFTAKGAIADPARLAGLDLAVGASIPDLGALSPLAGRKLPALKQIAFKAKLTEAGSLSQGVTLRDMTLTLPQANLAGSLTAKAGKPPALTADLTSSLIDADALRAALGMAPTAGAKGAPPAAKPAAAPAGGKLFSDTPLPFALLRLVNADVRFSVASLRTGGETWHAVAGHLVLAGGRLRLDPFAATPPAGHLTMTLAVDAAQAAPPVALTLHAPGVSLASLLAMAGKPGYARGTVAIDADLHGAGTSPHAIAAGLNGVMAMTMSGGEIDNRLIDQLFGKVAAAANPAGLLGQGGGVGGGVGGGGGNSQIRCLALRLNAHQGVAKLDPFLFSSTLTTIGGGGTLALGPETLDLKLAVQGRVGGSGIEVPAGVTGPFTSPHVGITAGTAAAGLGQAVSLFGGKLGSALPGGILPGQAKSTVLACPQALALARGQTPPPASATPAAQPTAPPAGAKPAAPNPANLLKQLFH